MTEQQLTTFDPAEGLTSDEAIAVFMADAFESGDAGYIAHALGVVARAKGWPRSPGKPDFPANSSTVRSASAATRRSRPRSRS